MPLKNPPLPEVVKTTVQFAPPLVVLNNLAFPLTTPSPTNATFSSKPATQYSSCVMPVVEIVVQFTPPFVVLNIFGDPVPPTIHPTLELHMDILGIKPGWFTLPVNNHSGWEYRLTAIKKVKKSNKKSVFFIIL